jgi:hypothetical protein
MSEKTKPAYTWYAGWGIIACAFSIGSVMAIGGLLGLLRTEYKTTPGDHAIILGLIGCSYGFLPGAFLGLLLCWLRRRRG